MKYLRFCSSCVFAAVLAAGCEQGAGGPTAIADLTALGDSGVDGTVEFTALGGGKIRVVADLYGLLPGSHGLHIHEFGDCSDPNGLKAGDHFNPEMVAHGGPGSPVHHVGDLGNVTADNNGRGYLVLETSEFTLDTGARGILGRAVVVHAKSDDLMSQPSGNSGDRIGCGVIRAVSGTTEPVTPDDA